VARRAGGPASRWGGGIPGASETRDLERRSRSSITIISFAFVSSYDSCANLNPPRTPFPYALLLSLSLSLSISLLVFFFLFFFFYLLVDAPANSQLRFRFFTPIRMPFEMEIILPLTLIRAIYNVGLSCP
jgi:hypothetical protein